MKYNTCYKNKCELNLINYKTINIKNRKLKIEY